MSTLSQFAKSDKIEDAKEFVGGSYYVPESGVYLYTLTKAYLDESPKKSRCAVLELSSAEHTFTHSIYFTTNETKGCDIFYKDPKGKKRYLPSFILIDDLCKLVTEAPLSDQDTELKTVKIRDRELKKDVGKKREVLVDFIGKQVFVALKKSMEDQYRDPSKEITKVDIAKFFDSETKRTAQEISNDLDKPDFYTKWLEKHKDVTEDNRNLSLKGATPVEEDSPFDADDSPFKAEEPEAVKEEIIEDSVVEDIEVEDEADLFDD